MAAQQVALQATTAAKNDEAYFRENIGKIETADDLISDRRLLTVALTAYGLEGDLKNKAFIRKVLEDGTLTDGALSGRLANKQYERLSADFGFGDFAIPRSKQSDFADKILAKFRTNQFETAVGNQNNDMRLALNTERELVDLAAQPGSEDTKWFTIMGNAPLRTTFQTALGLPASFASIDLDQQLGVLKSRAQAMFGADSVSQFSDPEKVNKLVRTFLARSEISAIGSTLGSPSVALQLLQSIRR
ncbi:MAG: DUF1217 domain-containing protein [Paracoccaceae bacterium]